MKQLFVVALALAAPAVASAAPDGPSSDARVLHRVDEAMDAVEATDDQRAATRAIVERTLPEMRALREEGQGIRDDVRAAFESDEVDRVALEDARLDLVDLFDRATITLFGMFADIADLYRPEQRAELRARRDARRRVWRQRLGLER